VETSYALNGRVVIFEAVGNDSIRVVWVSPRIGNATTGDTPRYATFGDLDNDGKLEVIYQLSGTGVCIFEWDGVVGSDNYGTQPSQVINNPFITGLPSRYVEYFEVRDVDGDAMNDLILAYDATTGNVDDKYYVIKAVGDWSTNDPGFSSFEVPFFVGRTESRAATYGLNGSPIAMISAQLDGTGPREFFLHNWNLKNIVPVHSTGVGTFVLPDSNTGFHHIYLSAPDDNIALFGALAVDIDNDGREEVYFPTYSGDQTTLGGGGRVHMVSYNAGQPLTRIDSTNVTVLDLNPVSGLKSVFGFGWGDINNNGKRDLYFSTSYNTNVVALEFQGGDKRNVANWIPRVVYRGDSTIYTALTYRDSVGRRDTIRTIDPSFASKIYARNTDFDRDGREDIILPYQALSDSMSIRTLVWNTGANRFDTTSNIRVVNPKRWSLRVIERDPGQGVEGKDITIITPDDYRLEQNYPNPFNPSTTISFYLPIRDRISLKVYDLLGREVRTLINNEEHQAGTGSVVWDGKDNAGRAAATGTYFYTLKFGNFEKTNKAMLVK
jgi:hypothetical protein